jgi:aminopeptidase N
MSATMTKSRPLGALLSVAAAISLSLVASPAQAAPAAAKAKPAPGAPGIGDPLFPNLGNGGYDVTHYSIDFDWNTDQSFGAHTGITAKATQALSRFDLDLDGNTVGRVTVDGVIADWTRLGEELIVTPRHALKAGKSFRVDVTYSGRVDSGHANFAFFTTESGGFCTANQPNAGHAVFPSNDHPADKATYDVHISAPTGWTAISNGTLDGRHTRAGRVTWDFTERYPMATELVSIAVDKYAELTQTGPHGLPIRHLVPADQADYYRDIVNMTPEQVVWMEDQIGRYPFENYGVHIVKAPLGFALENQTLSIYDPIWWTFPQSVWEPTMVHELAHQWFGDSVAPAIWSDVWLNEGHATWYEAGYAQLKGYYALAGRMRAEYARADLDRQIFGPVSAPRSNDFNILFGRNVYDGGALALFALHEKVGDATFRKIERQWVQLHRDGVVGTQDFISLASKVSHQDLQAFLADWLYGTTTPAMPGHPDWTVNPVNPGAASAMAAATRTAQPRA